MSNINQFREMIKDLKSDVLSEICEQFLFDHEGAMRVLLEYCKNIGMHIDESEIKELMHKYNNVIKEMSIEWTVIKD